MLKLSSDCDFLWAKSINGYGINFTLDSKGNSIVTSSPVGIFIIEKLNPTGNTIWFNTYGNGDPIYSSYPGGIVVDSDNSFYISGSFSDTLELDENGIAAPLITGETNYKTFLAKFNSSGEFIWNKSFSGSGISYSNNLFLQIRMNFFLLDHFKMK